MTFAQFAEQVLAASDQIVEPITDLAKRQILRRLLRTAADADRLTYFRPIAGTAGLADVIVAWISELKRHEIWPEDFDRACRQRGLTPQDRELILLYHEYQRHLRDCQLYDAEGRFWTARELLRGGQARPFAALRHVVVDGFTDFTRTQHEILALLTERVESLFVSLPLEAEADRRDLFAKPRGTLERLRICPSDIEARDVAAPGRRELAGAGPRRVRAFQEPAIGAPLPGRGADRSPASGSCHRRVLRNRAADQAVAGRRGHAGRPDRAPGRCGSRDAFTGRSCDAGVRSVRRSGTAVLRWTRVSR